MKRIIPLFVLTILLSVSCEKENQEIARTESEFTTNLGLKFIFLNEENEDLIEKGNVITYPITFKHSFSPIDKNDVTENQGTVYFNGNANRITYDENEDKNIWETVVYGFDNIVEYETYIHFEGYKRDTVLVKYSFSTDCLGRDYCANIEKVYYNDILVSKGNTPLIRITKTKNQTVVKSE